MTLISEIDKQISDKDGRTPFFYRRAFRGLVTSYANNPRKFITDEKKDREGADENLLRRVPKMGHLMMFQYQTESKNLKVYDEYPLVYIVSIEGRSFTGCNLHYIHPIKRELVVENLKDSAVLQRKNLK